MAGNVSLSRRDIDVLGKIRNPESSPASTLRLDISLPKDPHITDAAEYAEISQKERELVLVMQQAEIELAGIEDKSLPDPIETYRRSVAELGHLIIEYPNYASAMNNRAQALRRLYGDGMLAKLAAPDSPRESASPHSKGSEALLQGEAANQQERAKAADTALSDLDRAITLLMPSSPSLAVLSPTAAKTLSLAFTQRAAIYYATSKRIASDIRCNPQIKRPEARWSKIDFEEAASRDFAMGGHFGNEIARGLAVGTNPTAKLCGHMVQQMMKSEYGPEGEGQKRKDRPFEKRC